MRRVVGVVLAGLVVVAGAEACARAEAPSGGPEDFFPPYVIETVPDTFSTVEPGLREVFFRFSERISERAAGGRLDEAVVVSPSPGEVRVKHGREGITVEMEEGLAPDLVYRITVLPVIRDMFANNLRDPFELVLTTGAEIVPNVVAGMVEDRVTGRATGGARVQARFPHGDDTLTHWNFADTGGVFSLRYVPAGPCALRAWQDQNRNGEVDGSEPQTEFVPCDLPEPPDTALEILTLIQPDTTAPRLTRVEIEDSVTLRIEFDDYIEPTIPEGTIRGIVTVLEREDSVVAVPDSVEPAAGAGEDPGEVVAAGDTLADPEAGDEPGTGAEEPQPPPAPPPEPGETVGIRIFQEHEYEIWLVLREDSISRADSIARALEEAAAEAGDSAAPGEAGGEADPAAAPDAAPPDPGPDAGPGGDPAEVPDTAGPSFPTTLSGLRLPSRTLVGVLDEGLVPDIPYELVVEGVGNIAGEVGGGGVDTLTREPPPPPEEPEEEGDSVQAADTTQGADTTQAADTTQGADTTQAADTTTTPPDTTSTPPDTTTPPPDTNRAALRATGDRPSRAVPAPGVVPTLSRDFPNTARPAAPFARRARPPPPLPPRRRRSRAPPARTCDQGPGPARPIAPAAPRPPPALTPWPRTAITAA